MSTIPITYKIKKKMENQLELEKTKLLKPKNELKEKK